MQKCGKMCSEIYLGDILMKYKLLFLTIGLWLLSIFLMMLGLFGVQVVGYAAVIFLFIGMFINPLFTNILKKRFFFETTNLMKVIAVAIAAVLFVLIKLDIIGNKPTGTAESTTSSAVSGTSEIAAATIETT